MKVKQSKHTSKTSLPSVKEMFREIKKAIRSNRIKVVFRDMGRCLGEIASDGDGGYVIKLNPNQKSRSMWSTFLHELIHLAYPKMKHDYVYYAEYQLFHSLNGDEVEELISLFGFMVFGEVLMETREWEIIKLMFPSRKGRRNT